MSELIITKNQQFEISASVQVFNYKYLLISFMVVKYSWEQYINIRQLRRNLIRQKPVQLQQYNISHSKFLLSQSYSFDKIAFEMLALSIKMAVGCLSIACNILPFIWDNVDCIFPFFDMNNQVHRAVGFVLIYAFKYKAFQVPISAYQTFVIQKKYNFTNITFSLFIYHLFVDGALTLIIFPAIIYGYVEVMELGGDYFYVFLQILAIAVTILLTIIHPNLISPLFNKFTELKDSELKMKIYTLAHKKNIKLSNILVMHSSVKTNHSNSYLYGLGRQKTIVLYDTLFENLAQDQIVGVVAHQLGHSYYSHSFQKMFVYLVEVICIFYIFALFTKNQTVLQSFGFDRKSAFIGAALFFQLFQPLIETFNTILLIITRKFQFEADTFACKLGLGNQLKKSLVKLFEDSTSTVRPDKLYAWLKHSHPNIYERIDNIDKQMRIISHKNSSQYIEQDPHSQSQYSDSFSISISDSNVSH